MIKDSGERHLYETGAVRDLKEGKGRFDLVPIDILARMLNDNILLDIASYLEDVNDSRTDYLERVFKNFAHVAFGDIHTASLELAKHFEQGALKYGEHNWEKGIPCQSYVDSAIRHYIKWKRGDKDEPHDRAFLWNIICLIWTEEHTPSETTSVSEEKVDYVDPAWKFDGDL